MNGDRPGVVTRRTLLRAGAVAAAAAAVGVQPTLARRRSAPLRPRTIVLVLVDDMRADFRTILTSLNDGTWVDLTAAIVQTPMCGPSRAGLLTAHFAARTGVDGNATAWRLDDSDTIATRMRAAGYRTALIGKYLNEFPWDRGPGYVPPGWDVFHADGQPDFPLTPWEDITDHVFGRATALVRSLAPTQPLFLQVSPLAPHDPTIPAARHATAPVSPPPRPPSFDEADVSDKRATIRNAPRLTPTEIADIEAARVATARCLLAVDEGLAGLLAALRDTGRLADAVIVFTSDNGFLFGEHRVVKKGEPYEEAAKVPLMVRWPGVPGRRETRLASLVDVPATLCALAGTTPPGRDGVDLAPLLTSRATVRSDTYLAAPRGVWHAVRTPRWLYLEQGSERELYDLTADPWQLTSLAGQASVRAVERRLRRRLAALRP